MKKAMAALWMSVCLFACFFHVAYAEESRTSLPRVVDQAALLSDDEKMALEEELTKVRDTYAVDVVIVTVLSTGGKTPQDYADDYFDDNGYGVGANRDGVLLLIGVQEEVRYISTCGYGITAFTDYGIQAVGKEIRGNLDDKKYAAAFQGFAGQANRLLKLSRAGTPYDVGSEPLTFADIALRVGVILVLSALIAFIAVSLMKKALNTAVPQTAAQEFVKKDSFALTKREDVFLSSNVTKTPRPKENNSGGSSTHTSDSGSTHGGGSF